MIFPQELREIVSAGKSRNKGETYTQRVYKSGPGTQAAIAAGLLARGKNVVMVVPGVRELSRMKALLNVFSSKAGPFGGSSWVEFPPYPAETVDAERWSSRWAALYSLASGTGAKGVILTPGNLLPKWPPRRVLDTHHLVLRKGEEILPEDLIEQLVTWGYRRSGMVTRPGEMAMRGDIFDVFVPGYSDPLRFEFFGDTIEDIRLFDANSQRSKSEISETVILPVLPAILAPAECDAARERWEKLRRMGDLDAGAEAFFRNKLEESRGDIRPGLFYPDAESLDAWLPDDAVWILCGAGQLRTRMEETEWHWAEALDDEAVQQGWRRPRNVLIQTAEAARKAWQNSPQLHFEDLTIGEKDDGLELPEKNYSSFEELFWRPEDRNRPWQAFLTALKKWSRERPQVVLSFRTPQSRKKFLSLAEQEGIVPATEYQPEERGLFALVSPLKDGVELQWNGTLVLGENVIQPSRDRVVMPGDVNFKGLSTYEDLSEGDLIVHREWGLSRFGGLHRMKLGSVSNDYLLLFYSGDDKLYVPVDRLDVIQRYKGPEGSSPTLDKLGGTGWSRAKSRARKAIEKIARELVEMYAWRKVTKGFSYSPVDDMFAEFEASFGFEETPDQEKAIHDVLADMEKNEPMDRLVCGDVGFGKTEIAMRAAFRAALDGRQVAILCPTTVLAEQHYQNFRKRMENFPVTVSMLSRFVPRQRQKAVLAAAARGEVDILIGTHRLLSQDVHLPNLGLLILDEEQRFGVKHKERLKQLRKDIDVLALTATPIPRTLQLSLSGIRSLSVMETPPVDRKPVQTSLLERDNSALRKIIEREIERDGQIFWVHNRVRSLPRVTEYVQELMPSARVGMAHGQMKERELEETIHKFWHGELDVLVCTAIVESGLDFPRANTLVVDQAQLFGLGQLYQLRGRVGRSATQAYAYFVVPSIEKIPEQTRKRLQVILDMDYLGAGFQIAMEDLRLRGAGNILGEVQSGSMAKVGLDMFLEMLEEEVRHLRGEKDQRDTSPELNILFEAHIPEDYIPETRERLRYYKALSTAEQGTLEELESEIRDRFGAPPVEFQRFANVLRLKRLLGALHITKADVFEGRLVLHFTEEATVLSPEDIVAYVQSRQGIVKMLPPDKLEIRSRDSKDILGALAFFEKELTSLVPEEPGKATE
ncbi:transcription-repair coupling factor (superfamily II helicase) [Desulfobaculum bizertense DSM 18034]|uniref:Transcription-repair-coupling factor n=1 Tax=Desulfobaculum bizertense DSM 18034 TaxID=1121442 RepID=A0A1T4W334_9BACT|nr:transcription-repair coupling factor [Desulfobaculum bizertense]SKA71670.1 transcription-repair coupling factor (superfamily II helicase) [Desulfobaculum bizertense DSM 18034]